MRGQNVPRSYNYANILAHQIDFLNKWRSCEPRKKSPSLDCYPANLIRLASWRRPVITANTIGFVNVHIFE
jgi:hypothetical protein